MKDRSTEFDYKLIKIYRLLKQVTKKHLQKYDLTMPRFKILWAVKKIQPASMSEVHENIFMANSTLSILVNKLVKDNFLYRYRNPEDRRVVLLKTTETGDSVVDLLIKIRGELIKEALNKLEVNQQKQLIDLLQPVLNYLEKNIK